MVQLMEYFEKRQQKLKLSNEKYANLIGLTGATLWRYYNNKTEINLDAIQKITPYYVEQSDFEMLGALAAYALDIPVDNGQLEKLGQNILAMLQPTPSP